MSFFGVDIESEVSHVSRALHFFYHNCFVLVPLKFGGFHVTFMSFMASVLSQESFFMYFFKKLIIVNLENS